MKKTLFILFVTVLLTACSNNSKTEEKKETSDSTSKVQDSSKIKNEPAHSMTPRRPRD